MKRTILVGVMVLGTSICSQSFGFDLLDRMLGLKGSGCDSTCCDTVVCEDPCGSVCEPACGLEAPCGSAGGCAEPACGCEAPCASPCGSVCEPACGAEAACCGKKKGLLKRLFGGKGCLSKGCDSGCGSICEPACGSEVIGCEVGPACGCEVASCKPAKGGLLKKLFGKLKPKHGCDSACDVAYGCDSGCNSCGSGSSMMMAPTVVPMSDAAPAIESTPMPPAPVVDHSAFLNTKRRVIQASTRTSR